MVEWLLKYWLQVLFTGVTGALAFAVRWIFKRLKKEHNEQEFLKNGVLALLRNSIIHNYNDYMERGYVPIYSMESIADMYQAYHDLGGNGTVTKLYHELKELPSIVPSNKKKECDNTCLNNIQNRTF